MTTLLVTDPLINTPPKEDWQYEPYDEARLPTPFEVEDVFLSVKQMGGTVIRVFAFSVEYPLHKFVGTSATSYWMLANKADPSQGFKWNPAAGANFDHVIAMAHKYDIRIIPAFINEWTVTGGVEAFCAAYGKDCSQTSQTRMEFFSDQTITSAFFGLVHQLVSKYKDEPAILGWETGNEIGKNQWIANKTAFDTWTVNLAATVKQADSKALVVDGAMTPWADPRPFVRPSDGTDIIDVHVYPTYAKEPETVDTWFPAHVEIAKRAEKALMVGEVICHTDRCLKPLVDAVIRAPVAAGLLVWALTGHTDSTAFAQNNDDGHPSGGFFYHHENSPQPPPCVLPGEDYWNYHWPGFAINHVFNESTVMAIVQYGAAHMNGNTNAVLGAYPSPLPVPPAPIPTLLEPYKAGEWLLYFSGSAGAEWYKVMWATSKNGPFQPTSNGKVMDIAPFPGKQYGFPPVLLQLGSGHTEVCVTMVAENREKSSSSSAPVCVASGAAADVLPRRLRGAQ
eukprot:TRINITY_DN23080_c0_g1_i1.p1 TRINITY_DN23080_c0_g1~~TRINITY_DN23080_c0_g1_i1.p1  ORF type:complete len:592 (-),score=96.09 TRINITY_DN23080_c0_g1_i1:385-1908(-)